MSSEQLDPRIPPPPPPLPPLFAATNAENGVANGIFNTANPANVTDQPSTDAFLGCAYADSFFNISNVVPNRRLVRHDGIDRRSVTRGGGSGGGSRARNGEVKIIDESNEPRIALLFLLV